MGTQFYAIKICCISCNIEGQIYTLTGFKENEKSILEDFWKTTFNHNSFVTFNGNEFDVPVLMFRSMMLGVTPLSIIDTNRYGKGNHRDLRAILGGGKQYPKGTLDFFCKRLGCPVEPHGNGSMVQGWYDNKDFDSIVKHCQTDVKQLKFLYEKMSGVYF